MAAAKKARAVLIGNGSYGLYIGETAASDKEILADKAVRLSNCRHVRYWYGKTGGRGRGRGRGRGLLIQ